MKKILLTVFAFTCIYAVNAQDLKKVNTVFLLQRFEDAKMEIDKAMADPKAAKNPQAWLWKARVYGALFTDDALRAKYPTAVDDGIIAFRKYVELEPSLKALNEDRSVIDYYYATSFKQGVGYFDKKDWEKAFKFLALSAEMGDMITANNWKNNNQKIDTTTVLFSGYAAQNAKKTADAAKYYSRIADLKIKELSGVGDLKDIYHFLVDFYMQEKNQGQFTKYVNLAKELYPGSATLWGDYETEYIEKNYTLAERMGLYDKLDAEGKLTSYQYLAFGNMFYNARDEETTGMDSIQIASLKVKAQEAFVKAYNKDNTNGIAAFNAGLLSYNEWGNIDDAVVSNIRKMRDLNSNKSTDKDPKKRAAANTKIDNEVAALKKVNVDLEKKQQTYADKGIEWIEKSYTVLSAKANADRAEKNVVSKSVDYLANLYQWKRDKAKGNQAEYDRYDALYKKYDALHGK